MLLKPKKSKLYTTYPVYATAGGGGYTAQGVNFNGSTFLVATPTNTAFTGSVDNHFMTVSFWAKMQNGDGQFQILFEAVNQGGPNVYRDNTNKWNAGTNDTSAGTLTGLNTSSTFLSGGGWHHIYIALDNTSFPSGAGDVYVDGVSALSGFTQTSGANSPWASALSTYTLGARFNGGSGSLFCQCDIADFWMSNVYLQASTNITKFRDSGTGKPVSLGTTGSTPTGTAPLAFFSGSAASWATNKGTGGLGFNVTGTLSAASSNP